MARYGRGRKRGKRRGKRRKPSKKFMLMRGGSNI
jgi:hypothetical protein